MCWRTRKDARWKRWKNLGLSIVMTPIAVWFLREIPLEWMIWGVYAPILGNFHLGYSASRYCKWSKKKHSGTAFSPHISLALTIWTTICDKPEKSFLGRSLLGETGGQWLKRSSRLVMEVPFPESPHQLRPTDRINMPCFIFVSFAGFQRSVIWMAGQFGRGTDMNQGGCGAAVLAKLKECPLCHSWAISSWAGWSWNDHVVPTVWWLNSTRESIAITTRGPRQRWW